MKKSVYIMSSIEIIVGAVILAICSIVKTTLPVLGRVAYQAAAAGSYSPMSYDTSFSFANTIAVLLIIVGIGQMVLSSMKVGREYRVTKVDLVNYLLKTN